MKKSNQLYLFGDSKLTLCLKNIENENRLANEDEQEILARYCGWGGAANAFDSTNSEWTDEYLKLKPLQVQFLYLSFEITLQKILILVEI